MYEWLLKIADIFKVADSSDALREKQNLGPGGIQDFITTHKTLLFPLLFNPEDARWGSFISDVVVPTFFPRYWRTAMILIPSGHWNRDSARWPEYAKPGYSATPDQEAQDFLTNYESITEDLHSTVYAAMTRSAHSERLKQLAVKYYTNPHSPEVLAAIYAELTKAIQAMQASVKQTVGQKFYPKYRVDRQPKQKSGETAKAVQYTEEDSGTLTTDIAAPETPDAKLEHPLFNTWEIKSLLRNKLSEKGTTLASLLADIKTTLGKMPDTPEEGTLWGDMKTVYDKGGKPLTEETLIADITPMLESLLEGHAATIEKYGQPPGNK